PHSVLSRLVGGGPTHTDLCDPKPELTRQHGKPLPARFGKVITPMGTGGNALLASKRKFAKYGQSGLDFSDWLPHMATCADDIAMLRACWADGLNHAGSGCQMNRGTCLPGGRGRGGWEFRGRGSANQTRPGSVALTDPGEARGGPKTGGTGYRRATSRGPPSRTAPTPTLTLTPPADVGADRQ